MNSMIKKLLIGAVAILVGREVSLAGCTVNLTINDVDGLGLRSVTGQYFVGGVLNWSYLTDINGYVSVSGSGTGSAYCRALLSGSRLDVCDSDSGGGTVTQSTSTFTTYEGGTYNRTITLNVGTGVNSLEGGQAFREMMRAWRHINSTYSYDRPLVTTYIDASTGPSCGGGTTYFPHDRAKLDNGAPSASLPIDDTMLHEYGHTAQFSAYGNSWGQPSGCTCANHGGTANDCSFDALIEGWANYFPVMLYNHINSADTHYDWSNSSSRRDIESNSSTDTEERDEYSFAGVLFDIYDTVADGGDGLSLDDQEIWTVLRNDNPQTVEAFFQRFNARYPSYAAALEQIYLAHGMHPTWLTLSRTNIAFGASSTSQDFTIRRVGWYGNNSTPWNRPSWTISKDVSWITSVSPNSGDTETETDTITVTVNRSGLGNGTYTGHIVVTPTYYGRPQVITVTIIGPRPNLDYMRPEFWTWGITPRATNDATSSWCPVSPILPGNQNSTWPNWACQNNGSAQATSVLTRVYLDDDYVGWGTVGWMNPGDTVVWANYFSMYVTGGRHTLKMVYDPFDTILEIDEGDNSWSRQYIWSPYELTNDVPVWRSAPPVRGSASYDNCDGFSASMAVGQWWCAVGILPYVGGDDYDIRFYEDYVGSTNGFDTYHVSSSYSGSNTDFVVVNRNNTSSYGPYYAGVIRYAGGNNGYRIQQGNSGTGLSKGYTWNGPFTNHSYDTVNMYEAYIGTTAWVKVSLDNQSGTANLGLTAYDAGGSYFSKSGYLPGGYANSSGSGGDESMWFWTTNSGWYGIAVWKNNAGDYGLQNTYNLKVVVDDAYEQNDTLATAYSLLEQTWLSSTIESGVQADDDWYAINVTPAGYERVIVTCLFTHAEGNIDMGLYNSSGTLLVQSQRTANNEWLDYTVSTTGTYYIRVYNANAGNRYDLWWDDILQPVTVSATDATAGEPATGQGSGTFTFRRYGSTASAMTVNFKVGGSATVGSDYTSIGTSVVFAAGAATVTKTVSVIDNNAVEPSETVVVTLTNGVGYTVGTPSSATVTVRDDDSTVTVAAIDATAGEPGTTYGTGTFRFTRTGFTTTALTVNFTVGGTATAGSDYTSLGTTVSFAAGASTATKTVSVIDDSLVEVDETVVVTLASGTGYTVGSPSTATVTIKDDDSAVSEIIVDNADATGVEIVGTWTGSTSSPGYWPTNYLHDGNTGKGTKSVTFRPTLPSAGDYEVSVWYTAGSNRATNVPMDIVYSGGTRTVLVNERVNGSQWVVLGTNSFAAGITGYLKIRTTETSSGYVIADAVRFKSVGVPSTPVVTVAATDATAGEPGTTYGAGIFTFTRTAPLTAALTVNFTVGGTATAGSDYTSLGTTVSFAAGASTATKTVNVIDDSLVEGDETVVVTLASGTGYTVGSPSTATVTIKDDDSAVSEIIVDNADATGVEIVGTWTGSTSSPGYWPTNYIHDENTGKGTKSVTFRPNLASAGNYEVSIWYTAGSNRATNVPMDIVYSGGTRTVLVNERVNGSKWVVLGTNSFAAGTTGYLRIRTTGTTSGYVIADAVRFKLAGGTLAAEVMAVTSSSSQEAVSVLEPIEVRTSDLESDTNGWKVVDGNSETFWQGQRGAAGWWIALAYGKNVKAQDVQVQWAEDSATNLLLLGSEDAEQWYEVAPLLKEGPVTFGYLWFVLPGGEAGIPPKVSEIRVSPEGIAE